MDNMHLNIYNIETEDEQIRLFVDYAFRFSSDWLYIDGFKSWSISEVIKFSKEKYIHEYGEQILRPTMFFNIGGDCDDQFIFILSYLIYFCYPIEKIYIRLSSWNEGKDFSHISLAYLDNGRYNIFFKDIPYQTAFNGIVKMYDLDALPESELKKAEGLKRIDKYFTVTAFK